MVRGPMRRPRTTGGQTRTIGLWSARKSPSPTIDLWSSHRVVRAGQQATPQAASCVTLAGQPYRTVRRYHRPMESTAHCGHSRERLAHLAIRAWANRALLVLADIHRVQLDMRQIVRAANRGDVLDVRNWVPFGVAVLADVTVTDELCNDGRGVREVVASAESIGGV